MKFQIITRAGLKRLGALGIILGFIGWFGWFMLIRMPGESYTGPLMTLQEWETSLENTLRRDLEKLAGEIGERNLEKYQALTNAADFLEASFKKTGYQVERQEYQVEGKTCYNLIVEIKGGTKADEIVVVGGHYDSVWGSPGANDNGTGAVATLALSRIFSGKKPERTLRFVEFVNEEPPYFQTDQMGSAVYAKRCRVRGEKITAMFSLETVGYYTEEEKSQKYPIPILKLFYPSKGNFIGFIGNRASKPLVEEALASFRHHAKFPSEAIATFETIPGVNWSDQWAFWQAGYPAIMVTDTAPFRYPHYHTPEDTPDKIQYEKMARVVSGLEKVITDIVGLKER